MELYEQSFYIDIIESRLLESYPDYAPQGQYNNKYISCLYRYLKDNIYVGTHTQLYNELKALKRYSESLEVEKAADKQTYTLTDNKGISESVARSVVDILKKYSNYKYIVNSEDMIKFKVNFGWMPPNSSSYLNLLNEETLIDYYIDGVTLRPNTHTSYKGKPDSGYVCYKIDGVRQYNTIMFLLDKDLQMKGKLTFASLLTKLVGTKGATLNRIAKVDPKNAFYELGPYNQNYLTATDSSLIIQVPYEYAVSEMLFVYDVSGSVLINSKNNTDDPNDIVNFYVAFDDVDYDNKFIYNTLSKNVIEQIIDEDKFNILDTTVGQYVLGNFIWRTSDYKLISYAQNLVKALYSDNYTGIVTNGVWSDVLSKYIEDYKHKNNIVAIFDDDVIDITTEQIMIFDYKRANINSDPNVELFEEW